MADHRWQRLPCGVDPAALLDGVADGTPPSSGSHEDTCPYCQTAIGELATLWEPVTDWAQQPTEVPRDLLRTVITRVRRLAQSPHHLVAATAHGVTTATSWVIGLVAADATTRTPGVLNITDAAEQAQRRRRRPTAIRYGADGVDVDEAGEKSIIISLGVHARADSNLIGLADDVRHNVINAIRAETGLDTEEVNIRIDDIS